MLVVTVCSKEGPPGRYNPAVVGGAPSLCSWGERDTAAARKTVGWSGPHSGPFHTYSENGNEDDYNIRNTL